MPSPRFESIPYGTASRTTILDGWFCGKLGTNEADTFEMLRKAYGNGVMKQSQTSMWHKRFREGRKSVNDNFRSEHLSTSQTHNWGQKKLQVLYKNRLLSVWMIAEKCDYPKLPRLLHKLSSPLSGEGIGLFRQR
ncbi:hypothetical protein TNCV_661441 [Trichonephila clavipes]|nr:hypothetical protein TNCV_661441 [Trichonephila clavipes]